jgi:hypothetical protein
LAVKFPAPHLRLNGRRRWTRRQIREYRAALRGDPPPLPEHDDNHLLGVAQVEEELSISRMFIHRHSEKVSA